jgi:hypothetical protein
MLLYLIQHRNFLMQKFQLTCGVVASSKHLQSNLIGQAFLVIASASP